ncbi:MAG TPA: TolC family protein [Flavobacterium sp.]|nr:TolC family protein [Flavobacterium sp.]
MKQYFPFLFLFFLAANAQEKKVLTLELEQCYRQAQEHYPLTKKRELIAQSKDYSLANISKGYLPQFGVYGQATYQSDVTKIPVSIPGITIPEVNKDQYKLYGELNQVIYDGGAIQQQKRIETSRKAIESEKLEVELYNLKDRINNLYFGILIVDEQLKQNELLKSDIQTGINTVDARIKNGTALRSNADVLKAEYLKVTQQTITLKSNKRAYLDMLGLFINAELDSNTILQKPETPVLASGINRPELKLYQAMNENFELEKKTLNANNLPKLNLFIQGGVGNPALNMFSDGFDSYYIGGIRLSWPLSGFYTQKKQKAILDINKLDTQAQQETFLFNTTHTVRQQNAEITKLQEYLAVDSDIITLRGNVKKSAVAQLQNGVITANDYVREVNAENESIQDKIMHETQLLLALYKQKIITGN